MPPSHHAPPSAAPLAAAALMLIAILTTWTWLSPSWVPQSALLPPASSTLWLSAPADTTGLPPVPVLLEPLPAPTCDLGGEVRLAGARPRAAGPTRPEAVALWTVSPTPVPLDGWTLQAGSRRLSLHGRVLAPLEPLVLTGRAGLGSLRLRDDDGAVALVDPCGCVAERLGWPELPPAGHWVRPSRIAGSAPLWEWAEPGAASGRGGCGQT